MARGAAGHLGPRLGSPPAPLRAQLDAVFTEDNPAGPFQDSLPPGPRPQKRSLRGRCARLCAPDPLAGRVCGDPTVRGRPRLRPPLPPQRSPLGLPRPRRSHPAGHSGGERLFPILQMKTPLSRLPAAHLVATGQPLPAQVPGPVSRPREPIGPRGGDEPRTNHLQPEPSCVLQGRRRARERGGGTYVQFTPASPQKKPSLPSQPLPPVG